VSIVVYGAQGRQFDRKLRLATKEKRTFQTKAGIFCLLALDNLKAYVPA
jgi:hypothetical protein